MAITEKKSFCRICGSACGLVVELDGQTIVKVKADEDHPLSRGYTCPKGRAVSFEQNDPGRLDVPLIRENGKLRPTTWDHLLDDLASKLSGIIDAAGPRGVGTFIGGGGYLDAAGFFSQQAFLKNIGTPSAYSDITIDSVAKLVAAEMVIGIPGLEPRADMHSTKLVILIGTNPVISHAHLIQLHAPAAVMRDMRTGGAVLWVIDPRKTETALKADGHIAPRAGVDYAILAHLIRELLIDGADVDYLKHHAQDVAELKVAVERFTLARTSAITGVDAQQLRDLLAAVRKAGRLAVETGTGVTMQRAGNVTQWLSLALMGVTGSLDREGGAWINPGRIGRMDKMDIPPAPAGGWNQPGPASRPELRANLGEYPCSAMPDEIAARHLRAMVVFGGNLEVCLPQRERTYEALKNLEVMAVFDVRNTRTTDIATHVMPMKAQLERADMTLVTDGAFPLMATQYTSAVVEPGGERKAYWWVVGQLGKRMGRDFFPGLDVDTATDDVFLKYTLANSEVDFNEIKEKRVMYGQPVYGWLQRFVDEKVGGWRLAPAPFAEQLRKLEARESERERDTLVMIPRRQRYHENSRLVAFRDEPQVLMHSRDAQAAGLTEGMLVRVRSVNGWIERHLKIDDTLRPGCINVPHGWSDEKNTNRLTGTSEFDPITGMIVYSGLEVSVEAA